ncbi:acetylcholinesterase-1 [Ixodes scapularis]|uniref:acetylcholinesterase-1 n=1 Tax=Ixodes scapularis TaxID=6945 RepID=UPI001C385462|nr:acetylcholinesterase-1 [Ixodes scapularis]
MRLCLEYIASVVVLAVCVGANDPPVDFVVTKIAAVHGTTQQHLGKKVRTYLGVPYAEPPVGSFRFRKPVPAKQRDRMILATRLSPSCMQLNAALQDLPWFHDDSIHSEDCLYLNIWVSECVPLANETTCPLRPVLFWIHGGGFRGGSTNMDVYNGGTLAASGDVVVVTVNYRVGVFGFLNLKGSDVPGNMGLYDQHVALRWVYDNIHYFGGDPKQIVLSGQDAGAVSVGLHLISPLSRRLVKKAILIGGAPNWLIDPLNSSSSYVRALMLGSFLSCGDSSAAQSPRVIASCLKQANAKSIAKAESEVFKQAYYTFWPRDKDELVPMDPVTAIARGHVLPVDVLVGVTADAGYSQGLAFQRAVFDPKTSTGVTKDQAARILSDALFLFPTASRETLANFYFANKSDSDPISVRATLAQAIGDIFVNCPVMFLAESYGDRPMKAFLYKFSHRPSFSRWPAWYGTTHYDDVPFLFGVPLRHPDRFSSKDVAVSKMLVNTVITFATTGKPKPTPDTEWPQYSSTSGQYLDLSTGGVTMKKHPFQQCEFWRRYYPNTV